MLTGNFRRQQEPAADENLTHERGGFKQVRSKQVFLAKPVTETTEIGICQLFPN
jgi:hypothetical protein